MASVYDLKPAFQRRLRPIVRGLAAAGVTPNQVTVAAFLLSLASGAAIAFEPQRTALLLLLPLVLFVRMALNAIDGMLAREHDMTTPLGAMLNELGDVAADAALYLPLTLISGVAPAPLVLLVLLATFTELAGISALQAGASRRYEGPFGKSDRAFLVGALGLALGLGVPVGPWLAWLMWACAGLALLTIANRMRAALEEIATEGRA